MALSVGGVLPGARLDSEERVRIETLWREGLSFAAIGRRVGRPRCTIWRELARNHSYRHGPKNPRGARKDRPGAGGLYRWGYRACWAQQRARARARRPKRAKCALGSPVRPLVLRWLRHRWSPAQIAARLREDYPDQPELWVSHETIYQALYVQGRGHLRAEVARQVALRSGRTRRRAQSRAAAATRSRKPWIHHGGFHISARPPEVADRALPGHWEGDLVVGAHGSSAMVTLVERATRYVLLGALPQGRTSAEVIDVLANLAQRLPQHLMRSLTWDQGHEMAQVAQFRLATDIPVYFCDPHAPWQRGSNENTNGLLRQYFPRSSTDFRHYSQADLDAVAHELNDRPRRTLGYAKPAEALNHFLVAPTT